jgi:lipoyl(octanoyl) transferase
MTSALQIDVTDAPLEWQVSERPVPYPEALADMEARAADIALGRSLERVWLLEHPPLYTAGTSANAADLLSPHRFPVYEAGRGGQYTYHGPGQRIAYVQLDLTRRGKDIRCFVRALENWIIATLADFGVAGVIRKDRVGVWVVHPDGREDKVAALGVRVRKWVTLHGISINVAPDLGHFSGIVPCGIQEHGVTSLASLAIQASMNDIDASLMAHFPNLLDQLARACQLPR